MLLLIIISLCINASYNEPIGKVINRFGGSDSCMTDATINYLDVFMFRPDVQPWVVVQSTEGEL